MSRVIVWATLTLASVALVLAAVVIAASSGRHSVSKAIDACDGNLTLSITNGDDTYWAQMNVTGAGLLNTQYTGIIAVGLSVVVLVLGGIFVVATAVLGRKLPLLQCSSWLTVPGCIGASVGVAWSAVAIVIGLLLLLFSGLGDAIADDIASNTTGSLCDRIDRSTPGFTACDCEIFDASVTLTWVASLAIVAFLLLAIASCCTSCATRMLHAQWHMEATRVPLIHPASDITPIAAGYAVPFAVPCTEPYAAPNAAAAVAYSQFNCPRCGALVQASLAIETTLVQCGLCQAQFEAKLPANH